MGYTCKQLRLPTWTCMTCHSRTLQCLENKLNLSSSPLLVDKVERTVKSPPAHVSLSKPVGCEQLRVWPRPLGLLSDKLAVDVGLRRAEQCGPVGRHDLGTRATRYLSVLSVDAAAQAPAHEHAHAYTYVSFFSLIHDTATTSTSAWRTRNTVTQPFDSRLADYRRIKDTGNKEALAAARAVRRRLLWLLENHESSPDRYLLVPRVRQHNTTRCGAAFTCRGMSSFGLHFVLRRRRHVLAGRRRAGRRGLDSWTNLSESVDRASAWIVNVAFSWALFGNEAWWRHCRSGWLEERDDVTAARPPEQ